MKNKIFIERLIYEVDEQELYNQIKDLDYREYVDFRDSFLLEALRKKIISDTEDSKKSFWKRLMSKLKIEYGFIKPISTTKDALSKRCHRMK